MGKRKELQSILEHDLDKFRNDFNCKIRTVYAINKEKNNLLLTSIYYCHNSPSNFKPFELIFRGLFY